MSSPLSSHLYIYTTVRCSKNTQHNDYSLLVNWATNDFELRENSFEIKKIAQLDQDQNKHRWVLGIQLKSIPLCIDETNDK